MRCPKVAVSSKSLSKLENKNINRNVIELELEKKYDMDLLHVLSGHSGTVYQAIFLPADRLVTCSLAR